MLSAFQFANSGIRRVKCMVKAGKDRDCSLDGGNVSFRSNHYLFQTQTHNRNTKSIQHVTN